MVQRRRPPEIPPDLDGYGGHANYRERIREITSFKPLVWLGVLIGFGMWYAVGKLSLVAIDPGPDYDDVLAIFVYVIVGGAGFFAYVIALGFASSKTAQRGVLAAGALSIAFAAFYPFARDHRLEPVAEVADVGTDYERWLNELRAVGHVADAGVVPPFVAVRQRDGAVLVRNIAGRPLLIELALVQERSGRDGSRAWQRCPLANGFGSDEGARYWLPPLVSAWFEPNAYCVERFGYSEIEYRLGDAQWPVELSWRSTSALGPTAE